MKNNRLNPDVKSGSRPKSVGIKKEAEVRLPSKYGDFVLQAYFFANSGEWHLALVKGKWQNNESVLVRIHSSCLTGDIFGSLRCDCGPQLEKAIKMIEREGQGVLLYLNQEGRGIGLVNKIKAYSLQDQGHDTVEANHKLGFPADARNYEVAARILKNLAIKKINLLTNNPDKEKQLTALGIEINKCIPIETEPNGVNNKYLITKKNKLGHRLNKV